MVCIQLIQACAWFETAEGSITGAAIAFHWKQLAF